MSPEVWGLNASRRELRNLLNKVLNDLDNDAACARTSDALRKAFALVEY
jgi:hypothetical protein